MSAPDIANLAAELFHQRQHRARMAVRAGDMPAHAAAGHLRPWLAIACLAGADLSELADGIANRRVRHLIDNAAQDVSEIEARALLADEICPRRVWAPLLAKARDAALAAPTPTPDLRDAANALATLARHFAADPNGKFDIPAWRAPVPAQTGSIAA